MRVPDHEAMCIVSKRLLEVYMVKSALTCTIQQSVLSYRGATNYEHPELPPAAGSRAILGS